MYRTVLCLALLPFGSSLLFGYRRDVDEICALLGYYAASCANQKCCPDGECYDLGFPWQSLLRPVPAPRCIEDPVKYLLTNRANPKYPFVFSSGNFSDIKNYYSNSKPTAIVFHGWLGSEDTSDARNITSAYLTKVDANVIFVDYGKIALNINYLQAVSDIRVAARYVVKAVQSLIDLETTPSQIHLIGFSIGAHLAAYIAKAVPGIGRLTGLDPAGPDFTYQSCEVRLCKDDANFTEAIHTYGHPLIGYGTSDEDAHVDFWVNGGWDQPGCGATVNPLIVLQLNQYENIVDFVNVVLCSHGRSMPIYSEALTSKCTLWGVTPTTYTLTASRVSLGIVTKSIVHTDGCKLDNCVPIGLETINATGRGDFIVPTNSKSPFCVQES